MLDSSMSKWHLTTVAKGKKKKSGKTKKASRESKHIKGGGVVHQNSLFISVAKTDFSFTSTI